MWMVGVIFAGQKLGNMVSSMMDDRCGVGRMKDIVCWSCCCSMLFEMLVLGDAESWDRSESLDFYFRLLDALASR